MADYKNMVSAGKHLIELEAVGTGIAANRSNAVEWFKGFAPIYGVSGLFDSTSLLTRTDDAVGMTYLINSSSGMIESDFNEVFPWNKTEIVYTEAGKFVSFPEMYFRIGTDNSDRMTDAAVSEWPSGTGTWYKTEPFLYACYGASVESNKMRSVTRATRQSNRTRAQFRTYAASNGAGYCQLDLYHRSVLNILWLIEWANKNSRSIMTGVTYDTAHGGAPVNTGGTDQVLSPSGYNVSNGQMRYHYIEDYVGNQMEFIDGVCSCDVSTPYYVTADPTQYSDTTVGMEQTSYASPSASYWYISGLGWDSSHPFLVMPTVAERSAADTFCETYVCNSSQPVVLMGNHYYSVGSGRGVFSTDTKSVSATNSQWGGRLIKLN